MPRGSAVSEVRAPKQPHAPRVQVTCSLETVGKARKYNTPLFTLLITKTARKLCNVGYRGSEWYLLAQGDEGKQKHRFTNGGACTQDHIYVIITQKNISSVK